mmetsp:Transcript_9604/g.32171  ORF Transcript_9604/g.32171 Transcript_9604/m.32171 type:complete len:212 (+) Transcript_9604:336-971(+)
MHLLDTARCQVPPLPCSIHTLPGIANLFQLCIELVSCLLGLFLEAGRECRLHLLLPPRLHLLRSLLLTMLALLIGEGRFSHLLNALQFFIRLLCNSGLVMRSKEMMLLVRWDLGGSSFGMLYSMMARHLSIRLVCVLHSSSCISYLLIVLLHLAGAHVVPLLFMVLMRKDRVVHSGHLCVELGRLLCSGDSAGFSDLLYPTLFCHEPLFFL